LVDIIDTLVDIYHSMKKESNSDGKIIVSIFRMTIQKGMDSVLAMLIIMAQNLTILQYFVPTK